ncbi:AI-2E family transporter [Alteromonas sp. a30]|uniref:AI-2E family transporter n=1 Tax=Alteromonas sp. a30 TaxID=2730917 RepID=UPI002280F6AC|nr:AI-2E family transporter [Alteromonas sp. a30]MCY7294100.1 AI-2E family transporter [Alteromonas sp. a30]
MFEVFGRWYKRKFSDPDSAVLLMLLVVATLILTFWGDLLAPILVAVVLAYLLDWPVNRLEKIGLTRTYASLLVLVAFVGLSIFAAVALVPVVWQQGLNFLNEIPQIWQQLQSVLLALPNDYPQFFRSGQIANLLQGFEQRVIDIGQQVLSASFSSLFGAAALLIYLILVPIMLLFMLKDKNLLLSNFAKLLPKERRLIKQVGQEMNIQILNYIRGKVIEIIIVGTVSAIAFALMDLRYALLLGVLVGFSVLIPYIGAAVVTIPIAIVALFQWGVTPDFWTVMIVYGVIQALDGNALVPILFSEAVSLHPVYIIVAVLVFGGLWGFWGVFFAIPLASLVRALFNAWSSPEDFVHSIEN